MAAFFSEIVLVLFSKEKEVNFLFPGAILKKVIMICHRVASTAPTCAVWSQLDPSTKTGHCPELASPGPRCCGQSLRQQVLD